MKKVSSPSGNAAGELNRLLAWMLGAASILKLYLAFTSC